MTPVDVLALGAHPDDVELSCGGTLAKLTAAGKRCAIVDLTQGEMGTRGTVQGRAQESADAAEILGVVARENLGLPDGYITADIPSKQAVIRAIRHYRPQVVLGNAPEDRHPDHGNSGTLIREAVFLAGLAKIETEYQGEAQQPWRPPRFYHYIQDRWLTPSFIVDISTHWHTKLASIKAHRSQFYDPNSDEPDTYIASPAFWEYIHSRHKEMGHLIGTDYGEGFISPAPLKVDSPLVFV